MANTGLEIKKWRCPTSRVTIARMSLNARWHFVHERLFAIAALAMFASVGMCQTPPLEDTWTRKNMCGVNSVYLLARMSDIPLTYGDVARRVSVSEEGSDLLTMRNGLQDLGLNCSVRRVPTRSLDDLCPPLIAHLSGDEISETGHYVVVESIAPEFVTVIDSTTAIRQRLSKSSFKAIWTGYLLSRDISRTDWPTWSLSVLVCLLALCWFLK